MVPGVDVTIWEVGVPVLSEALQRENECFDLASRAASSCFDGHFVLKEEIFWVEVSIELRENSWVEAWRPWELLDLCRERCGEALLWPVLMRHHVFAFLFV